MAAMRRGDFPAAWAETDRVEAERRALECKGRLVWQPHHLLWNGEPFAGRRVLVRCLHGLGDTLQFGRFLPQVKQVASELTLLVQPALLGLLEGDSSWGCVRDGWSDEPPPPHEVAIEIMELGYAFRCRPETLPKEVPYLPMGGLRGRAARLPLPPRDGACRIGVVWAASDWDPRRSLPLALLDGLGSLPNTRFFSLQQGAQEGEWAGSKLGLVPLAPHTREIASAAAAMLELDLILTVDCMVAHLAGALGRPVWMLTRREADWRWMRDRRDSPWYPTMRLFRQEREGEWKPVVEAVREGLRTWAGGG